MPERNPSDISEILLHTCHDLRAPLRAVRVNAELLLRDSAGAEPHAAERLGFIVDGTRKIELLINSLSRYSIAMQMDGTSFQATPMEVVLRGVLSRLDRELNDNHAEVTYGKLPRVLGNPDRLMEVFESLLLNAVRHRGAEAPRIHVSAEEQGENCLFAVRDNGPGVETEYLESIFRPFDRLHGTGTGLGLAICREIVARHGGKIWAKSEGGKGATFLFTLPAA